MTRGLYLTGDEPLLELLREIAMEEGLSAFWIREKPRAKKPGVHPRASTGTQPASNTRAGKILLEYMRITPLKEWDTEVLGVMFEEHGYKATSVSPIMSRLIREGLVNRVFQGTYQLTSKGRGDPTMAKGSGEVSK